MNDLTQALLAAHGGQPVDAPLREPDFATAAGVQRDVARSLGASVAGWKVGFSADGAAVAGPLYASVVQSSPARRAVPAQGFIVEIELAFRLARDLPPRSYTRDDIVAAASEALVGIELIRGRLGEPPGVSFGVWLADNLGNDGYVTGGGVRAFASLDLRALPCRFEVDGKVVQEHVGGHPQGDPVEPLRAYASRPIDALGGLRAGQVITTGSLTKPLRIVRPASIAARLDGIGEVKLELTR
jgi:2-keto-4-pentenoate hydratase